MMTTLNPPLKWAGGKRWLVPYLDQLWQPNRRLVEPFCGGLAVTLGLMPERALLSDINTHLINFYEHLQRGLSMTIPMQYDSTLYYAHRKRFNELIRLGQAQSAESAQLFYYLNRTGYNGLCRFNRKDEFNVPFGKYKTINYTSDFSAYPAVLSSWEFRAGNFDSIALQPDDFIYADPPYDVEFVSYTKHGFDWNDQVRLTEWLAAHAGPVVLSNQATDRVVKLYEQHGFSLLFLMSPRRINSTGDRTPAREVLAIRGMDIDPALLLHNAQDHGA
jgi:DNA adenine methylase